MRGFQHEVLAYAMGDRVINDLAGYFFSKLLSKNVKLGYEKDNTMKRLAF